MKANSNQAIAKKNQNVELFKLLNMRKKLLIGGLSFCFLAGASKVYAQDTHFKCGSHTEMNKLYEQDPSLKADYIKLLNKCTEKRVVNGKSTTVRTIPVVFHIVHEYGPENISDAQIFDQMAILNEDYNKTNADTNLVISQFDTIIGKANIQFRLASIDPWGNPTNGIDRIYSHMTNQGDDYSKINQWKRSDYLNVWVVKTIGSAGVAGYAYYPTGVTGAGFWRDGILILHDYIGSIGTGSAYRSRALTHEIGHWLGLAHTWGNDNDPGVATSCGQDDGIEDTPNCIGQTTCNLTANTCVDVVTPGSYWQFDAIDNVQNFMEYSYCSVMFTKMQTDYMNNVLDQITSDRNHLYTAGNLDSTGTATLPPAPAVPVADFYMDQNGATPNLGPNANGMTACVNDPINFYDASWKATITSWSWSFPGGSPATSTAQNPSVTYAQPGWYPVTLTVTSAGGTNTVTKHNYVYIQGDWAEYVGPRTEDFNQNMNYWISYNPENNHARFQRVTSGGKGNSACIKLNNYYDNSNDALFSDGFFYNDRLGGSKDYLITPAYDLRTTTGVSFSFDYAFGTKSTNSADVIEKLIVQLSTDCGKTWTNKLTLTGTNLLTAGYVGNGDFTPSNDLQWKNGSFTFTPNSNYNKVKFRFEFTASDKSSNLFLDNINISGTLGIEDNGNLSTISVSPNPVSTGSDLSIEISSNEQGMKLILTDVNGSLISTTDVAAGVSQQTINIPMNVAKGCYILTAVQGASKSTHRVVVF